MPIEIETESDTGVAVATGSGVLRLAEAKAAAATLWETRGWPGRSVVWDLRAAETLRESSEVRDIADFVRKHQPTPPPERVAFVVERDVEFGMARMFQVYREDSATDFRVFRDYDEAMSWARFRESPSD